MEKKQIGCIMCYKVLTEKQNEGTEKRPICKKCREAHFITCADCGRPFFPADMYYEGDDTNKDYPHCLFCAPQYGIKTRDE